MRQHQKYIERPWWGGEEPVAHGWLWGRALGVSGGDPEAPARMVVVGGSAVEMPCQSWGWHTLLVRSQGHDPDLVGVWKCFDRQWGAEGGESPPE